MKIIIDIPRHYYKLKVIENGSIACSQILKAVKNGTPYEERSQGEWIPVSEKLPEGKTNPKTNDFEEVLCTTIWGDVRHYKFGKPIGHDTPHFWYGWGIMDKEVIAWQPLPEPYKEADNEQ